MAQLHSERRTPTVPIVGSTKSGKPKILLREYLKANVELIESLLRFRLTFSRMDDAFDRPYFFVDDSFNHLSMFRQTLSDYLRGALEKGAYSKRDDIRYLYDHEPLSPFQIIRLHHNLSYAASERGHLGKALLSSDATKRGLRKGSVVPSIRYVDPDTISRAIDAASIPEDEIVSRMRDACAEFDGEDDFFSDTLIGKQKKGSRITTPTAQLIHFVLAATGKKKGAFKLPPIERLFPEDAKLGPKKKAKPVSPKKGNLLTPFNAPVGKR